MTTKEKNARRAAERATAAWDKAQKAERKAWFRMERACNKSVGIRNKWALALALLFAVATCHAAAPLPPKLPVVKRLTPAQVSKAKAAKTRALNPPQKRGAVPTVAMAKAPAALPPHVCPRGCLHIDRDFVNPDTGGKMVHVWMIHDTNEVWVLEAAISVPTWDWFPRPNQAWMPGRIDSYQFSEGGRPGVSPVTFYRTRFLRTLP